MFKYKEYVNNHNWVIVMEKTYDFKCIDSKREERLIRFQAKIYDKSLKNKAINNNNKEKVCPYCKTVEVIKFGKFNGVQRYRCKNRECGRTFNEKQDSPFRYSKKFRKLHKDYHELYKKGLTIRECATKLNISIVTSFFWRHRFLYDLKCINYVEKLCSYVELTRFVIIENFKGNRTAINKERGKISIVNGIDDSINIISIVAARNHLGFTELRENIAPRIDKKAYAIGILDGRLNSFSKKHNKINKIKIRKEETTRIDELYSVKTKRWFKKFYGVATKYIDHYLNWRAYEYKNNIEYDYRLNNYERRSLTIELKAGIDTYISWSGIKKKVIAV